VVDLQTAIQLGLAKYVIKVIIAAIDTPFIYLGRAWKIPPTWSTQAANNH